MEFNSGFKGLNHSGLGRSSTAICCVVLEGNISFGCMETRYTGICLLLFCYRRAILLVEESVFDFPSNGRGFFPALLSRNDGVVLLFLLYCLDALEYLFTVLISLLCSGLSRVRLIN